jgi:hypothetical protein
MEAAKNLAETQQAKKGKIWVWKIRKNQPKK